MNRVAVTGMGIICSSGFRLEEAWNNIATGKSAIGTVALEGFPPLIGGKVTDFTLDEKLMDAKNQKRYDRFLHFALHASDEAIGQSGFIVGEDYPAENVGVVLGVGMGGFPHIESNYESLISKGFRRVSPFFIPSVIPNMAPGLIALSFGFKGINFSISSACASAGHAIGTAACEIMIGRHDVVISGGSESTLSQLPYGGFTNMKALSKETQQPRRASRPFDRARDGFVMGEGAGIVVLENYEKAKTRGATILAELVGYGFSEDAYHVTAPHPDGEGAARCMSLALKAASIDPRQVGYLNAHGTSTPVGDASEIKAVRDVFTTHAPKLAVSSTKSMTGHLLGAAGGIESIFCIQALRTGDLPPTINLDDPDDECGGVDHVAHSSLKRDTEYALNNSFGFGGTNASLVFKRGE